MQIFVKKDKVIIGILIQTCSREERASLIFKGSVAIMNERFCDFTQLPHANAGIML
jgi:hypothetical protein